MWTGTACTLILAWKSSFKIAKFLCRMVWFLFWWTVNCAIHLITLVFTARPFSNTHNFELLYFIHNFNFNLNVNGRHFPSYIIVKIKTGCDVIFLPLVCIPYSIKQTIYFSELFMLYLIFLCTLLNIKQYWNIKTNIGYYKKYAY